MIGVAVVGYGYWGPNLVRNLADIPDARLLRICDLNLERLAPVKSRYPQVEIGSDYDEVLRDPEVDAVAIATPVSTHFRLAMGALMAGKHVFVEKPIAASAQEAERLVEEAAKRGLVLAVDHTFVHTGAVKKMRELVETGLGDIYYYDSVRVNLGLFQHDVSVVWDLAVHDLSIMDRAAGKAGCRGRHGGEPRRRPARKHRLSQPALRQQPYRPCPCELAGAGEDPPYPHRREPAHDRL
jgi:predicted dehydrogenase